MPPTLDLTRTAHSKVTVSRPRMNLRRASSYNHEKGPLSSTSSRFSFNHLVFASPPPSPGLPQLVTRPRKPSNAPRPSRVLRVVLWAFGVFFVYFVATSSIGRSRGVSPLNLTRRSRNEYEMVGQDDLPDFPTPIIVSDQQGEARWTVSIPPNYDFPLTMQEYADVCAKCHEVAARVNLLHNHLPGNAQLPLGHDRTDRPSRYFVDVHEAERAGHLPGSVSVGTLLSQQRDDGDLIGENKNSLVDTPVCATSMTFILASDDAGLGRTLMLLWMSYALAQHERRAFFIDDTRWAYGKYTGIFQTPPIPDCRPPLRHEMLPCPRQARHLVVTASTVREIFNDEGIEGEKSKQLDVSHQRSMFDLAREGYEGLFRLNGQDDQYVTSRVKELKAKTKVAHDARHDGMVIGVHVRRGDRHPLEFQYRGSYIPTDMYTERVREILNTTFFAAGPVASETAKGHSLTVLASDDPIVYETDEFAGAFRAQELIRLASKAAIQQANPDKTVMHKFIDETFGWEGGFFAPMFWNLGLSSLSAANAASGRAETKQPPSSETIRLRSLVGRAYMMDLAVLAGASDTVICTVSAMGCRLLGVMMGWEKAMVKQRWVNIDGDYGWSAAVW